MEEEYVTRAVECSCDRDAIAATLDISERSTVYKERRALAYDFPLDAIDKRNVGRPAVDDESDACAELAGTDNSEASLQQQLDTVAGSDDDTGADAVERATESERDASTERSDAVEETDTGALREQLRKAIAALEEADAALWGSVATVGK